MLREEVLEDNMRLYLQQMERKHDEDRHALELLQQKINNAARKIQRLFRKYIFRKRTKAARKIQHFWKNMYKRLKYQRSILNKVKIMFHSYKILYFFKERLARNRQKGQLRTMEIEKQTKNMRLHRGKSILHSIQMKCKKLMIVVSSISTEIHFVKKYQVFDKQNFTSQWQGYESKQRDWMWQQIKKKWVRKQGEVWINEQQKQINAVKYINNLIEQCYMKHYEKYQASQKNLQVKQNQLRAKMVGVQKAFLLSVLMG